MKKGNNGITAMEYPLANCALSEQAASAIPTAFPYAVAAYSTTGNPDSVYINDKLLSYLGYTRDEFRSICGDSLVSLIDKKYRSNLFAAIRGGVINKSHESSSEYRIKAKSGKYKWFYGSGHTETLADGTVLYYDFLIDIDKHRQNVIHQKKETAKFNEILENTPAAVGRFILTSDTRLLPNYISPSFCGLAGYSRDEFLDLYGSNALGIVNPDDRIMLEYKLRKSVKRKSSLAVRLRILHKDGYYVWLNTKAKMSVDEDNIIYASFTDISDLKEMERIASEESERFRSILFNVPCGIAVYKNSNGSDYSLIAANPEIVRMAEQSYDCAEDFLLRHNDSAVHPDDRIKVVQEIASFFKGEKSTVRTTIRLRCKGTDKYNWISCIAQSVKRPDGSRIVYVSYTDFNYQMEAEERKKRQKTYLYSLYDMMPYGITICTPKMKILYVNPVGCRIHNASRRENGNWSYSYIHSDDTARVTELYNSVVKEKGKRIFEYRAITSSGKTIWINNTLYYTEDENGVPVLMSFYNDITEFKRVQEQLENTLKNVPGGIATFHIRKDIIERTFISAGATAVLGYRTGEQPESNLALAMLRIHETERHQTIEQLRACTAKRVPLDVDFRVILSNGKIRWINLAAKPVLSHGELYYYGIYSDISSRKALEVKERNERDSLISEHKNEMFYLEGTQSNDLLCKVRVNLTYNIIEASSANGIIPQIYEGRPYSEANLMLINSGLTAEMREELAKMLDPSRMTEEFLNGRQEQKIEYQRRDINGNVFWARTITKTYRDPDSGDLKSFLYTFNIDEEKTPSLIIDRFTTIRCELLGLLTLETHGIHFYRETEFEAIMDCHTELDYDSFIPEFINRFIVPESRAEAAKTLSVSAIVTSLESGLKAYDCSFSVISGGKRYRKRWEFGYLDESKTALICIRSDISEIFEREERQRADLQRALEEVKKASEVKEQFLARISHEMRTPMNAIVGLAEIAADQTHNPDAVADSISKISSASDLLLSQINDLLEITRSGSSNISYTLEPYSYNDFVSEINILILPQCKKKNIDFRFSHPQIPIEYILADKARLKQIFVNLLSNAVKYTNKGGIVWFSIEPGCLSENTISVSFTVTDNGIGMSEEFKEHMFEPYSREHPEYAEGTGLGLSIVKNIVEIMNGQITCKSKPDKGTTVNVILPLTVYHGNGEKKKEVLPQDACKLNGKRVLLVEDNKLNTIVSTTILRKYGITVEHAENGKIATEMFVSSPEWYYDAVLMDIMMPEMNGYDAIKYIRALDRDDVNSLPVIAVSANAFPEDVEKSVSVGANAHISKPIDVFTLCQTLALLIKDRQ